MIARKVVSCKSLIDFSYSQSIRDGDSFILVLDEFLFGAMFPFKVVTLYYVLMWIILHTTISIISLCIKCSRQYIYVCFPLLAFKHDPRVVVGKLLPDYFLLQSIFLFQFSDPQMFCCIMLYNGRTISPTA